MSNDKRYTPTQVHITITEVLKRTIPDFTGNSIIFVDLENDHCMLLMEEDVDIQLVDSLIVQLISILGKTVNKTPQIICEEYSTFFTPEPDASAAPGEYDIPQTATLH